MSLFCRRAHTASHRDPILVRDGVLDRKEFNRAIRAVGLTSVDAVAIDHLFDQLDQDGSGSVSFRELRDAIDQSAKAEAEARARARTRALQEPPQELVDVNELRYQKQRWLNAMARELDRKAEMARQGGAPVDARARWRWAKEKETALARKRRAKFEKESLRMRLRLRGTELEPGQDPDGGFASELRTAPNSPSRGVTRHGRLPTVTLKASRPSLDPADWNSPSGKLAILAAHRRRSHAPAQRHCRVLLSPSSPTRKRLHLNEDSVADSWGGHSPTGSASPTLSLPALSPMQTCLRTPPLRPSPSVTTMAAIERETQPQPGRSSSMPELPQIRPIDRGGSRIRVYVARPGKR